MSLNYSFSSYDPSSTLGTVGTLLNMICVVVGVNIVSFFIVKVCLFQHNTMGFLLLLLRLIVSQQTCWDQTVEVSVWWVV